MPFVADLPANMVMIVTAKKSSWSSWTQLIDVMVDGAKHGETLVNDVALFVLPAAASQRRVVLRIWCQATKAPNQLKWRCICADGRGDGMERYDYLVEVEIAKVEKSTDKEQKDFVAQIDEA